MNVPATGGVSSSGSRGPGVGQAKCKGEVREAPPASKTAAVSPPTPVPVEDNTSAKQLERNEKTIMRAPQRPPRGEDSPLSLVSSSTTMVTTTAVAAGAAASVDVASADTSAIAPAVSDRQQRSREELAGLEGGGGTAAAAAAEGGGRGVPEETSVTKSATDRTTGIGLSVGPERTETTFEPNVGVPLTPRANGEEVVVAAEVEAAEAAAAAAVQATTVTGSAKAGEEAPEGGRWPATLDARWAEVEFMLCHEVESEESLQHTIEATKAGLVFMDKLEKKAQV